MSTWKDEKKKYIRLSMSNIPDIGSSLYYKFAHTIRDKHLAICELIEVKEDKLVVDINGGLMEANIKDFFIKK